MYYLNAYRIDNIEDLMKYKKIINDKKFKTNILKTILYHTNIKKQSIKNYGKL